MNIPGELSQKIPIPGNALSLMKKHTCFSTFSMIYWQSAHFLCIQLCNPAILPKISEQNKILN